MFSSRQVPAHGDHHEDDVHVILSEANKLLLLAIGRTEIRCCIMNFFEIEISKTNNVTMHLDVFILHFQFNIDRRKLQ